MRGSRRDFLVWISSAAGAAAIPGWLVALLAHRSRSDIGLEEDLRSLVRGEGPPAVGRAYLRTVPSENDPATLVGLLLPDRKARARFGRASQEQRREALRARVREDFGAGRVARVQGWVLARTEARLCALAALA